MINCALTTSEIHVKGFACTYTYACLSVCVCFLTMHTYCTRLPRSVSCTYCFYVCCIHVSAHLPSSHSSHPAPPPLYYLLPWLQGSPGFCTPGPTPPPDPQCSGEHTPGQGYAHHYQVKAERSHLLQEQLNPVQ